MRIAVIGSGYVGLVSGACLADFGHEVICVDNNQSKIEGLMRYEIPIYEPGLEDLVRSNVRAERLVFSSDLPSAVAKADVVFIAVGTPSRRGDGFADLTYVYEVARQIAHAVRKFTVVVTKSTVPVGTGDEVQRIIADANRDADVAVVSNPEFLREGAAIADFKRPDRVILGIEDKRAIEIMSEVYRPLSLNKAPIVFSGRRTAELTKYAANAFLAMKISFINEIADLCEKTGADVQDVALGIGLDKRIGSKFLHAGPGFGGSCFPKDTVALVKSAQDHDSPLRLVETTIAINDQRKRAMARRVVSACGGDVRGRKIAVLGLTFKPNTDDMREAPSLAIIQGLEDAGATMRVYDPKGMDMARTVLNGSTTFCDGPYEAAEDADALILVTEWDAFRALDLPRLRSRMRQPVFVDLRNVYRKDELTRHGFSYVGVGRP